MKWFLILLLLTSPAFAGSDEFSAVRESAPHYWRWAKANAEKYFSKGELSEGLAVGDAHVLNLGYTFIGGKYQFALEDIDDVGIAPLLLDFARLVVSSEALNSDISTYELLEAYQAGLEGKQPQPVSKVKDEFSEKPSWDIEKLEELDLLEDSGKESKKLFAAVEKDLRSSLGIASFSDVRVRIKDSGGSRGQIRFWVAIDGLRGTEVYEFKHLAAPATSAWRKQASPKSRFANTVQVYRKSSKEFQIVETTAGSFFLRPRYDQPEPVEDLVEEFPKSKRLKNYSLFVAQAMGIMHRNQAAGKVLKKSLTQDFEKIFENLKSFRKDYLEALQN